MGLMNFWQKKPHAVIHRLASVKFLNRDEYLNQGRYQTGYQVTTPKSGVIKNKQLIAKKSRKN